MGFIGRLFLVGMGFGLIFLVLLALVEIAIWVIAALLVWNGFWPVGIGLLAAWYLLCAMILLLVKAVKWLVTGDGTLPD